MVLLLDSRISEIQFIPTWRSPSSLPLSCHQASPEPSRKCQPIIITLLTSQSQPWWDWYLQAGPYSLPFHLIVCLLVFISKCSFKLLQLFPSKNLGWFFFPPFLVLESKPTASYTLSKHSARVLYPPGLSCPLALRPLASLSSLCSPGWSGIWCPLFPLLQCLDYKCLPTTICADQPLLSIVDSIAPIHWI